MIRLVAQYSLQETISEFVFGKRVKRKEILRAKSDNLVKENLMRK